MKRFFMLISLLVIGISCKEDLKGSRQAGNIDMMLAETQCANPWAYAQDKEVYKNNISGYLTEQGLNLFMLELKNELPADTYLCEACTCWSGNNIYINIADEQQEAAEVLGFSKVDD